MLTKHVMLSFTIFKLIINAHHFYSSTFNLNFYNGGLSFELIFMKNILFLEYLSVNQSINQKKSKKKSKMCYVFK